MAKDSSLFINLSSVAPEDLQASPNPDGSDFSNKQIIEHTAGCPRLRLDVYGKAVASLDPEFVLYRWQEKFNAYCEAATIKLASPITNTTTGVYVALESLEVGNGKLAIALKSAETGSTLKAVWTRTSIQGV